MFQMLQVPIALSVAEVVLGQGLSSDFVQCHHEPMPLLVSLSSGQHLFISTSGVTAVLVQE